MAIHKVEGVPFIKKLADMWQGRLRSRFDYSDTVDVTVHISIEDVKIYDSRQSNGHYRFKKRNYLDAQGNPVDLTKMFNNE